MNKFAFLAILYLNFIGSAVGSDLVMSAGLGAIRLYGKVGVGTMVPYEPSLLHVKAANSPALGTITEASANRSIIVLICQK